MKHILTTIFAVCLSFTAAIASEKASDKAPQEQTLSKEEKAAAKAKKDADLQEAFKAAGFTALEEDLVKTSYAKRSANTKLLKADTSLSEEDVKAKSKEFSTAEDDMLKEKIGLNKYKAFKAVQKAQKEAQK